MEIFVHRRLEPVGNGPTMHEVFELSLPGVIVDRIDNGPLILVRTEDETKALWLPYVIWRSADPSRVRFRWARRHATDDEKRLGIKTHGASDDLQGAAAACLINHLERAQITEDER